MTVTPITEPLSGVTTGLAGVTEPATPAKQWCIRFLMAECQLTGTQANRLFSAYVADLRDERLVSRLGHGHTDKERFLRWLMEAAPGLIADETPVLVRAGARARVVKWQLGQGAWRTR